MIRFCSVCDRKNVTLDRKLKNTMKKLLISLIVPAALLSSCGGGNEFTVSGTVENAKNETLMLERSVSGRWLRIDSIKCLSESRQK